MVHSPPTRKRLNGGSRLGVDGFPKIYKGLRCIPWFPQPLCSSLSSSLLPLKLQAWCRCHLFFLTTLSIIMFSKATLTFLAIGALSVNAVAVPVVRSPAPEPESEFPDHSLPYLIMI